MGLRGEAREALAAAGLRPSRRFGQHFLCDGGVVQRIVETANVDQRSTVLEIGPGLGALTERLAARAGRLYLIEVDRGLAERLDTTWAGAAHVTVVTGDVLEVPLETLVREDDVTVVANLPYNVGMPILFRLRALRVRFPRAVLMFQREVAERLVARPGSADWGITAVLTQIVADVRIAFGVSRRSFLPPPNVESAVVDVRWRPEPRVPVGDLDEFGEVVRAAFGKRRKMLRNALADLAAAREIEAGRLEDLLVGAAIDPRARGETLDLDAFARLARALAMPRHA